MGTTIYYKGFVESKDKAKETLDLAASYSELLNWKIQEYRSEDSYGIIISPHKMCEDVSLIFDKNLHISSFVKTAFASEEIHLLIIKLLYNIKKYFNILTVIDETGAWDEYNESLKLSKKVSLKISKLSIEQRTELKIGLLNKEDFDEENKWFWKSNQSICSCLNFSTIRDLMRNDLSNNKEALVTLSEVINISEDTILGPLISRIDLSIPLIVLTKAWLKENTENKLTPIKCDIFAWIIAHGCFCWHGGYLNNFHRQTEKLYDIFADTIENIENPYVTLEVLYTLLDYFKVKRNVV